jgi:hypothetical protein
VLVVVVDVVWSDDVITIVAYLDACIAKPWRIVFKAGTKQASEAN